jgi:hypothetical protein
MKKRSLSTSLSSNPEIETKPIQLLLHAPNGIVPYLTPILLKKYFPPSPQQQQQQQEQQQLQQHLLLGISVADTCRIQPIHIQETPNSVKSCRYEFVHQPRTTFMNEYPSILVPSFDFSSKDMTTKRNPSSTVGILATEEGVGVWTLQGRQILTNPTYCKLARTVHEASCSTSTVAIVSLFDQATDPPKRSEQAYQRTRRWCHELLSHCPTSHCCKSIWPAISIPRKSNLASSSSSSITYPINDDDVLIQYNDHVTGYAIVGWDTSSWDSCPPAWLANITMSTKSVAVLSLKSMSQILDCLLYNINVIGTNLPTLWSKQHQAFVLPFNYLHPNQKYDSSKATNDFFLLEMSDFKFAKDASPLLDGCNCMACQNHSKAYIHHLYQAKELLAQILLMSHNLHRMLEFCRVATDAHKSNQMDLFVRHCKKFIREP